MPPNYCPSLPPSRLLPLLSSGCEVSLPEHAPHWIAMSLGPPIPCYTFAKLEVPPASHFLVHLLPEPYRPPLPSPKLLRSQAPRCSDQQPFLKPEGALGKSSSPVPLQEVELVAMLLEEGQEHLFKDWPAPGKQDRKKKALLAQLLTLDRHPHPPPTCGPSPLIRLLPRGCALNLLCLLPFSCKPFSSLRRATPTPSSSPHALLTLPIPPLPLHPTAPGPTPAALLLTSATPASSSQQHRRARIPSRVIHRRSRRCGDQTPPRPLVSERLSRCALSCRQTKFSPSFASSPRVTLRHVS